MKTEAPGEPVEATEQNVLQPRWRSHDVAVLHAPKQPNGERVARQARPRQPTCGIEGVHQLEHRAVLPGRADLVVEHQLPIAVVTELAELFNVARSTVYRAIHRDGTE